MSDSLDDYTAGSDDDDYVGNPKLPLALIGGFVGILLVSLVTLAIVTDPSDRYPKPEVDIADGGNVPGLESGFSGEGDAGDDDGDLFADDGEEVDAFDDGDLFGDEDDGTDEGDLFADEDDAGGDGDFFDDEGDDISDTADGGDLFGDGDGDADGDSADFDDNAGEENIAETLASERESNVEGEIASAAALVGRNPLPPAPFEELVEATPQGQLPKIGENGTLPWQAYARPFNDETDRPRIAILLLDLGMMQAPTVAAIRDLPGEISLGFLPYSRNMDYWVQQSRMAGHEMFVQVPMEPYGFPDNDPGPHTLVADISGTENRKRLEWVLGRFTGYVGTVNFMGEKFMSKTAPMKSVATSMKDRGLMFLENRIGEESIAGAEMQLQKVPYRLADGVLDDVPTTAAINQRLSDLEVLARRRGEAMAIAHARPVTVKALTDWLEDLAGKGLVLAPVTALAQNTDSGS